jgi:hypothetical protein
VGGRFEEERLGRAHRDMGGRWRRELVRVGVGREATSSREDGLADAKR